MTRRLLALILALLSGLILSLVITFSGAETAFAQAQNSWTAQFYGDTGFATAISGATATYATLNMNWSGVPTGGDGVTPVPGVPADNFSVIFTSSQNFTQGTYRFTVVADDYARILIDGIEILNTEPAGTPGISQNVGVIIAAGTRTVQVYLKEFSGASIIQLGWTLESGGTINGTPGVAFTPTPTPLPTITPLPYIPPGSLTGTVIRASVLNIRDAPSTGGNRIGRILRGQTYRIIGRDSDARWFLLQLSGYQGWAYGYYLAYNFNEFTAPVVSGNSILGLAGQADFGVRAQTRATMRLRGAPTVMSEQIGRVSWGAFVPIVGRTADGTWYQIVWRGTVGWVFSEFVRVLEGDIANVPIR